MQGQALHWQPKSCFDITTKEAVLYVVILSQIHEKYIVQF